MHYCRQSYDVDIELGVVNSGVISTNTLDLKNPFFRYTGQQPQPPPGTNNTSPTELYWTQQEAAGMCAWCSNKHIYIYYVPDMMLLSYMAYYIYIYILTNVGLIVMLYQKTC